MISKNIRKEILDFGEKGTYLMMATFGYNPEQMTAFTIAMLLEFRFKLLFLKLVSFRNPISHKY